jgi:hypothetical protein
MASPQALRGKLTDSKGFCESYRLPELGAVVDWVAQYPKVSTVRAEKMMMPILGFFPGVEVGVVVLLKL